MVVQLPPCPKSLRAVQPYLKAATEHDERDVIVSYWCRLYALQTALTIDKKSEEARLFLLPLMEWLEKTKRSFIDNESITSDTAAQAYVENYALKLFIWADNMDRNGVFNKNVVKSFYTSAILMDVMSVFGELTDDIAKNRKYAKWKAAYIHNCLKNGENPVPGPLGENDEESELNDLIAMDDTVAPPAEKKNASSSPSYNDLSNHSSVSASIAATKSDDSPHQQPKPTSNVIFEPTSSSNTFTETTKLDASKISKAQKYCKFASSALNYEDIPEAISNLQKALKLLQTGGDD